ncbi:MAG: lantibiotic dehydratase [Bacteroidota bacterium]|nr:lantibiotic dehydratase [Bacteroidota bacterium]
MTPAYNFLPDLFLRAPYYSFNGYDLDRLPEVLADAHFRNAVYLASPGFYKVLSAKNFDFSRLLEKEKHTLCKYYNRMCFRPVPFGSFASFTLLEWGEGDTVRLAGDEQALLHILPDESLLTAHSNYAPAPSGDDLLIKSPTLYPLGREYRYIKTTPDAKGHYQFSIDALPGGQFHRSLLKQFDKGAVKTAALLGFIQKLGSCSAAEAQDYLEFLLAEQLLFPPERRHIIGSRPSAVPPQLAEGAWAQLRNRPFSEIEPLALTAKRVNQLLPGITQKEEQALFYAALERRQESGGPGPADSEALLMAMEVLQQLALPFSPPGLEQFAKDFSARFDLEKVPLLRALDPDAGIVYGTGSQSGFEMDFEALRFPEPPAKAPLVDWSETHRLLLRLWGSAQQQGAYAPLIIRPEDLAGLKQEPAKGLPPSTVSVMFRKTGDRLVIDYAGGAAAATALIGRFSAFSAGVHALSRKLAALEQAANPGIAFADLGQLSDSHTDNINRRQQVYPYEIPINVFPALPPENQILPQDLLVSVRGGQVILESVKLKQRVVPRLATAYNHRHNGLSLFRFLADLQYQGLSAGLTFSMEHYFPGFNFYPRVQAGEVIIHLARWHFDETLISGLAGQPAHELPAAMRRFRHEHGLPQRVSMGQTDQQLVFDFGDPREMAFFVTCIRGLKKLTLVEYLLPGRSLKCGNKPLAGQYIAFLSHPTKIYNEGLPLNLSQADKQRNFLPGDSWLYLKLYCTPESADLLLAEVIRPLVKANRKYITTWFFIRYFDSAHHLRLRFRIAPEHQGRLLANLKKRLDRTGNSELVRDYQGDIYRREMERYGANLIDAVEAAFCAGSELVAHDTAARLAGDGSSPSGLLAGIVPAFRMAKCFFPGTGDLHGFFFLSADRFLKGFAGGNPLKVDLDNNYRRLKKDLEAALTASEIPWENASLSANLRSCLEALLGQAANHTLAEKQALLVDLIHMQLNRVFPVKQRQQELMVHYFLEKYMASLLARSRVK